MKLNAWCFHLNLNLVGHGDDPAEAWADILDYSMDDVLHSLTPPSERVPEHDYLDGDDESDDDEDTGGRQCDAGPDTEDGTART